MATEQDNEAEWIPNKLQVSALPIDFPADTGTAWRKVLDDAHAVLTGDLLIGHWRMGDGATLVLACNLGREPAQIERVEGDLLYESRSGAADAARSGRIAGATTVALLVPAS